MKTDYDVIIIGGGTAGVIAAVQAGRAGVQTLLVEKDEILGGTLTKAGISCPARFMPGESRPLPESVTSLLPNAPPNRIFPCPIIPRKNRVHKDVGRFMSTRMFMRLSATKR